MQIRWLPERQASERIFGLDAFRGLAALFVFLFHFWTFYFLGKNISWGGLDFTAPFAAGHLGVDLFFVLSGFLIFLAYIRSSSLQSYLRRRLLRIVPLATFFTLSMFFVLHDFSATGFVQLFAHLSFLQGFFQSTYHGLHPVMWTLSVEMLFYLVLPLLIFFGRNKLWHFLLILSALLLLNFWYRAQIFPFFSNWSVFERIFYSEQLWGRFDEFALGMGLGVLWVFRERIGNFVQKFSSLFLFLGLASFIVFMDIFSRLGSGFRDILWLQIFLHFFVGLSFALFLLGFLLSSEKVRRVFAPQPL